jgi:hypothetical protein
MSLVGNVSVYSRTIVFQARRLNFSQIHNSYDNICIDCLLSHMTLGEEIPAPDSC